jgi:hypothetical protein
MPGLVLLVGAPAAEWGIVIATLALACTTVWLGMQARREGSIVGEQVKVSQASLAASLRPMLVDARPGSDAEADTLIYPDGSGEFINIPRSNLHVVIRPNGQLICSVAFRNIGPGVAFLQDDARAFYHKSRTTPFIGAPTRRVVGPNELVRVTFAITEPAQPNPFEVELPYTDAMGEQRALSKLLIDLSPTDGWYARQVSYTLEGHETVSSGAGP